MFYQTKETMKKKYMAPEISIEDPGIEMSLLTASPTSVAVTADTTIGGDDTEQDDSDWDLN
jgi:hypothetical protein